MKRINPNPKDRSDFSSDARVDIFYREATYLISESKYGCSEKISNIQKQNIRYKTRKNPLNSYMNIYTDVGNCRHLPTCELIPGSGQNLRPNRVISFSTHTRF